MVDARGGFVDLGETLQGAIVRELNEELGVIATLGRLVGVYSHADERVLVVVYEATLDGEPRAGDGSSRSACSPATSCPGRSWLSGPTRPRCTTSSADHGLAVGAQHGTLDRTMTAATPHPHVSDAVTVTRSAPAR